jgi:hypothetical protein
VLGGVSAGAVRQTIERSVTMMTMMMKASFLFLFGASSAFDPNLIANTQHKLRLSIGREPGTAMPPEWAASGARLSLPLQIQYHQEVSDENERLLGEGKTRILQALGNPKFVSSSGEQEVTVSQGGWSLTKRDEDGSCAALRFFLDFPDGAVRNDVTLPAERVFFTTAVWMEGEALEKAKLEHVATKAKLVELESEMRAFTERMKTAPLQNLLRYRSLVLMTEERGRHKRKAEYQYLCLPKDDAVSLPNGILLQKEGMLTVKRLTGLLAREEYHYIGRFTTVASVPSGSVKM